MAKGDAQFMTPGKPHPRGRAWDFGSEVSSGHENHCLVKSASKSIPTFIHRSPRSVSNCIVLLTGCFSRLKFPFPALRSIPLRKPYQSRNRCRLLSTRRKRSPHISSYDHLYRAHCMKIQALLVYPSLSFEPYDHNALNRPSCRAASRRLAACRSFTQTGSGSPKGAQSLSAAKSVSSAMFWGSTPLAESLAAHKPSSPFRTYWTSFACDSTSSRVCHTPSAWQPRMHLQNVRRSTGARGAICRARASSERSRR